MAAAVDASGGSGTTVRVEKTYWGVGVSTLKKPSSPQALSKKSDELKIISHSQEFRFFIQYILESRSVKQGAGDKTWETIGSSPLTFHDSLPNTYK
jgi:hypothetical protein